LFQATTHLPIHASATIVPGSRGRILGAAIVLLIGAAFPLRAGEVAEHRECDLAVIEATPGGIAMAVRAAREGLSVILVNHNSHLGGILSSGLGVWDTEYEGKRSPIYDGVRQSVFEYYRAHYGENSPEYRDALPGKSGHSNGKFEAHVIESILTELVAGKRNIAVLRGFYPVTVHRHGRRVESVALRALAGTRTAPAEGFLTRGDALRKIWPLLP